MGRNALVISGGTARGAYAAGLVKGLFTRFPELHRHVHLLSGTSTGSLITPALGLYCVDPVRHRGLLDLIVKRYQVPSTEAFRDEPVRWWARLLRWVLRGKLGEEGSRQVAMLAEQGAMLDAAPLRRTIDAEYTDALLQELFAAREKVKVFVNCVSAQTGGLIAFSSADETMTPERFRTAIFASCMQPVLMPLAPLEQGGVKHELMDGGVRDVVPVETAFFAGATRVLAFALFPDGDGVPKEGPFAGRENLVALGKRVLFDLLDGEVQDDDVLEARLLATLGRLVRFARAHGADDAAVRGLLELLRPEERERFLAAGEEFDALYVHRPDKSVHLEEDVRWTAEGMQKSIDAGSAAAASEEGQRMRDFLVT
ncbi:MAG: patatin-like phospholipase family protein [Myxococcota bacterium]